MTEEQTLSESIASRILDTSPDAILLVDGDGQIQFANDRVEELFGYPPAELHGEPVERLVPTSHRDEHEEYRDGYFADPETRAMGAGLDLSVRRRDGSTVPVHVALSPVDIDGDVFAVAVVRDVSERQELRAKYRTILQAVPDAVVVAEAETGTIVDANERVLDLFGREQSDLVGQPQTVLHPSDERERYRSLFDRHLETGQSLFRQFPDGSSVEIETADGRHRPVEINAQVFELGDRRLVVGVFRDVTSRRDREERLERLHTATRDLFTATRPDEVATIGSRAATGILDLEMNGIHFYDDGADALVPAAWSDALEQALEGAPPSIPAGEGLAWEAYASGDAEIHADVSDEERALSDETPFRSELFLPLGDHGVLLVSSTKPADFDTTDEALARVLAANIEAALDRVRREERLREQNERLDRFASIVSHDLRNPLNVAKARLDLARRDCDSEHLADVERAHDRMEDLIEDLLLLAEHGYAVTDVEPAHLDLVASGSWQNVDTRSASLDVETDRTVRADESRLKQLLENLFRNAVEHGGDDVTVTVGDLPDGFFVEDDGTGFPEGDADRVFETGYTTGGGGSGLGLTIVRQVATDHGWSVTATDGSDGGARFEFTGVSGFE